MLERARRHLARHGEWWWAPAFYALVVIWTYRGLWHQHGAATDPAQVRHRFRES